MIKNKNNSKGVRNAQGSKNGITKARALKRHIDKQKIGKYGEKVAEHYLRSKGFSILGRNLRLKRGEVDILAANCRVLHLVEVKSLRVQLHVPEDGQSIKTPKSGQEILPEDSFSKLKLLKLKKLATEIISRSLKSIGKVSLHTAMRHVSPETSYDASDLDEPVIQIDGIAVTILMEGDIPSLIKVRYYPAIV